MNIRLLKYGASSYNSLLKGNRSHNFAQSYALHVYCSNSIYTMIPKNACSTMRLSVAIANGAIAGLEHAHWIHSNGLTFRASLPDLMRADYAFVVLRCPYARLASCFLDKFTGKRLTAINFNGFIGNEEPVGQLTFRAFCEKLEDPLVMRANVHWRSQIEFLVFDKYDDYFCVERLQDAAKTIREKAGFEIVDARSITQHGIDARTKLPASEAFSDVAVRGIVKLGKDGQVPDPRSLYDDALIQQVRRLYADDFNLFGELFPGMGLFERQ
jgi:hypothetical protein